MFFTLLLVTFVLSLLVSVILVRAFNQPVERILQRIINDAIHDAWLKYLKFAICVYRASNLSDREKGAIYVSCSPMAWRSDLNKIRVWSINKNFESLK